MSLKTCSCTFMQFEDFVIKKDGIVKKNQELISHAK